jgi:hypothetical protein
MADGIGAYGPVVFQTSLKFIRTFQRLREERRAIYATHDVLSLEQKLQFLSLELARVDLEMEFHHVFCVPQDELARLRGVLESHESHPVVIGGVNLGDYVLESIRATWEKVSNKGYLLLAGAECSLREYR